MSAFCTCLCAEQAHRGPTFRGSCRNCGGSCAAFKPDDGVMPPTGEELRDAGVARVDSREGEEWKDRCDRVIRELATEGLPFTADDVRVNAGDPAHINAMGARFLKAARDGVIVRHGSIKSTRPERHATEMKQWIGAGHE